MKERKVLNLASPILRTWSSESHLMSMILQQENAKEWIFNNYINLRGKSYMQGRKKSLAFFPGHDPTWKESPLNAWTGCPFLEVHYVSHNFVKNNYADILEYALHALEDGFYLYLSLKQEKLKTRMHATVHKTFIYGFDRRVQKLYVADHYDNAKYALAEMGFDDFLESYQATYWDEDDNYNLFQTDKDSLFEEQAIIIAKPKAFHYEFNIEWFRMQLKDYLEATYRSNCVVPLSMEGDGVRYFGIRCYDLLVDYVDALVEREELVNKDWRVFTLLCDHKTILKMRTDFFLEKGICEFENAEIEKYDMLEQSSRAALNLFLKYKLTGEKKCLKSIKDILVNMKCTETDLLQLLLNKLS